MTDPAPAPRPPDHPAVPRPRRSAFTLVAIAFSALVIGGYAVTAYTGHDFSRHERLEIPATVRASPGGYRTYHFWHSGYHGGK